MAQSLAEDLDLRYEARDLFRARREFPGGPQGIFLKRTSGGLRVDPPRGFPWLSWGGGAPNERIFFAKAMAYPLAAAPFVRAFGTNGLLVLNVRGALLRPLARLRRASLAGRPAPGARRDPVALRPHRGAALRPLADARDVQPRPHRGRPRARSAAAAPGRGSPRRGDVLEALQPPRGVAPGGGALPALAPPRRDRLLRLRSRRVRAPRSRPRRHHRARSSP